MIKISISKNQPQLQIDAVSSVFLTTGMSQDESDYYAQQTMEGAGFEIDAPDNEMVKTMIAALTELGVVLTASSESLQ